MLRVNKPQTVFIKFTGELPRLFLLIDTSNQDIYYFRYMNGKTPRIKFNVPDTGVYVGNVPFEVTKTTPIEIPSSFPPLPPPSRDRWQDVQLVYNPSMVDNTPIRIYSNEGVIEASNKFMGYIRPIQIFLMWHEKGHMLYLEEEYCDYFALVNCMRLGYNESTCLYALSHILKRSTGNMNRIKSLLNYIRKIYKK